MNNQKVIHTRADLDAIAGTPEHTEFMRYLKGSVTKRVNTAVYPEEYDSTLNEGDEGYVAPAWEEQENLNEITRFGFTKEEILGMEL